jgi:nucleoside-triphosphatase THEP1
MQQALTKILTPKRNIDILREIRDAKAQKRPYTIVFVGVNGVGKSTSLSKVCSWLQAQQLKVLIAACDTFRAGAIEQLQVHARNLGVPVYHQGYGKDAASIAKEGVNKAQKEGMDVVLIDTAGRMQDNEPLMQALAKVIKVNNPDLIIFVGEALVGHDSVDQLTKFNACVAVTLPIHNRWDEYLHIIIITARWSNTETSQTLALSTVSFYPSSTLSMIRSVQLSPWSTQLDNLSSSLVLDKIMRISEHSTQNESSTYCSRGAFKTCN